ncbi:MAG: hypothetical protein ACI8TS_000789, partial [Flavobacteriales bacterium]
MDPLVEIIEVLDTQQKNEFENFLFIQRK